MSWFSDLTSKAEAMLIRLDQDAAQALQNPEALLKGPNKLLKQAIGTINTETGHSTGEISQNNYDNDIRNIHASNSETTNSRNHPEPPEPPMLDLRPSVNKHTTEVRNYHPEGNARDELIQESTSEMLATDGPRPAENHKHELTSDRYEKSIRSVPENRKFKLHSSRIRHPLVGKLNKINTNSLSSHQKSQAWVSEIDSKQSIFQGAADIRASISRSLEQYNLLRNSDRHQSHEGIQSSHFDDTPRLGMSSSSSFSIEVPSEDSTSSASTNIARQLLLQSTRRRSPSFNIQQVINRLDSDQFRRRLGRVRMRATSYARRMNFHLQAHPSLKLWILACIVSMQLLVIYVLFFYQSTSSSTDLSSQVKQQQKELMESQGSSEKFRPLDTGSSL